MKIRQKPRGPDYVPPADPKEEAFVQSILRRFGLADNQDYGKHLAKINKQLAERYISVGRYTKLPGFKKKTRNPNAPQGKRWGHWTEGGKAP